MADQFEMGGGGGGGGGRSTVPKYNLSKLKKRSSAET